MDDYIPPMHPNCRCVMIFNDRAKSRAEIIREQLDIVFGCTDPVLRTR